MEPSAQLVAENLNQLVIPTEPVDLRSSQLASGGTCWYRD